MTAADDKYIIRALADGLECINSIIAHTTPLQMYSIAELADICNLDYNKTFRVCKTIAASGWMEISADGKKFALSRKFFALPGRYLNKLKKLHYDLAAEVSAFNDEVFDVQK